MTHSDLVLVFMLAVVDAYQAWCGPCKTVVDLFRKIRNEVSSDLLHFAVAEVDSIDALEKYRGKCEPIFLFYTVREVVADGGQSLLPGNSNRIRGDGLTLCQGRVRLGIRKHSFSERAVRHWRWGSHRPWRCSELWRCGTEGCGHGGVGLGILGVFFSLNDSTLTQYMMGSSGDFQSPGSCAH
uniref:Thioredoxin domain-containing protein n=1 Tax=Pavo cristatus TaxID=9049 RepID=A0A8C9EV25_PAVCR